MGNKKSWFSLIKRLFISEPQSRLEKNDKRRRRRWAFRLLKVKELPPLSAPPSQVQEEKKNDVLVIEIQSSSARDVAATKIQAVFRGYLARKALGALKGVVKLQALIRGWAVRQQAINTLKCLQSLVNIQAQVFSKKCTTLHSQHYKSQEKDIKVDLNSQQKRLHKEEIKEYYLSHRRSAETERDKAYGRRRYWLEQWVDAQLAKSGGSPRNLDRTLSARNRKNQAESPTFIPKRPYHHRKQRSIGDEHSFTGSGSPSMPAYMASTESAKARSRSMSSPRLRPLSFDVCSEITSPYKHKLMSPISSINSELTSNTWVVTNSSPRFPRPIKSTMSTKEVRLRGIHHQNGTSVGSLDGEM